MQLDVLDCFETVLTKGDEARFRLYEVRFTLSYCRLSFIWAGFAALRLLLIIDCFPSLEVLFTEPVRANDITLAMQQTSY